MSYLRLGRYLPDSIQALLFGDRKLHGLVAHQFDPDWQLWRKIDLLFYDQNQRRSVGSIVNASGYRVMRRINLEGKSVLEIGPGSLDHISEWAGRPKIFYAVDCNLGFLERAGKKLKKYNVIYDCIVTTPESAGRLPLPAASVDIVLSFYSLEHLHPLANYISEINRVLKPGGKLVGSIPCEGGIGWGLGRYITTRRWLLANGISDPGKIISWEHPNFADKILEELHKTFEKSYISFWPLKIPIIDLNLVANFIMIKYH